MFSVLSFFVWYCVVNFLVIFHYSGHRICISDFQKSGRAQIGDGQQGERPPECKQQ